MDRAISGSTDFIIGQAQLAGARGLWSVLRTGAFILWFAGVVTLLTFTLKQTIGMRRRLRMAVLLRPAQGRLCPVFETDQIDTPFLYGIWTPKIYVPRDCPGQELENVLAHEQAHKSRLEHMVKPLCWMGVMIYWFHPLVWLSFWLLTRDMEMACDEKVLKEAGHDIRASYADSLLRLSQVKNRLTYPPAFGQSHAVARIKKF